MFKAGANGAPFPLESGGDGRQSRSRTKEKSENRILFGRPVGVSPSANCACAVSVVSPRTDNAHSFQQFALKVWPPFLLDHDGLSVSSGPRLGNLEPSPFFAFENIEEYRVPLRIELRREDLLNLAQPLASSGFFRNTNISTAARPIAITKFATASVVAYPNW